MAAFAASYDKLLAALKGKRQEYPRPNVGLSDSIGSSNQQGEAMELGMIGLGRMGGPMAQRLMRGASRRRSRPQRGYAAAAGGKRTSYRRRRLTSSSFR